MAGILAGILEAGFKGGEINPYISTDLNENTAVTFAPLNYKTSVDGINLSGAYSTYRIASANRQQIVGDEQKNFFYDYYFRVHLSPLTLNLKTVASSQTRQFYVWNAWPYSNANLADIVLSNQTGVEITGQSAPYVMPPLKELSYSVTVGISGPPNINATVLFDFSNVADPSPILITGLRATKFEIMPEVPVTEVWEWLTDFILAKDGSEQRIALRGQVPRIESSFKVKFDSSKSIRSFYNDLISSSGRLWIPEYQYSTTATANSAIGTFQIYFDNTKTDIRDGEYILIQNSTNYFFVEISAINASGALLTAALANAVTVDSLIIPGSSVVVDDQTSIDRYSVQEVGEVDLKFKLTRQRSALTRQGSSVTLPTFLSFPVLDKRPLAEGQVSDRVSTGQIYMDNKTGYVETATYWDYSRVGGQRTFKVNRIKSPDEMDYWKTILSHASGKVRKFWMPTYRTDLVLAIAPSDAASAYAIEGTQYAEKIWPIITHRYIEIETNSGTHRTQISGASISGSNSVIALSTPLPTGTGWQVVKRISYLLPVRLDDDKVEWKHYGLDSFLNISIRTAEP